MSSELFKPYKDLNIKIPLMDTSNESTLEQTRNLYLTKYKNNLYGVNNNIGYKKAYDDANKDFLDGSKNESAVNAADEAKFTEKETLELKEPNNTAAQLMNVADYYDDEVNRDYTPTPVMNDFDDKTFVKSLVTDAFYSQITNEDDSYLYDALLNASNSHHMKYYYGNNIATFKKGSGVHNISINFIKILDGTRPVPTANLPALIFMFDIVGVEEYKIKDVTESRIIK
jgi:hypothetical protein